MSYLNAYSVSRHYGGSEEGGWWYDRGRLLESRHLVDEDDEPQIRAELTLKWAPPPDTAKRSSAAWVAGDVDE